MVTLFLLLWGMASARIKSTNLDYRMVQQLDGLKRLVKLNEGVVATCNLVLIPQPVNYRTAEERCRDFDIGMGPQQGQLVKIKGATRSWALQLLMGVGLELEQQPEFVWASTRWAWTGLRKTQNYVGKVKKSARYTAGEWQWADGTIPGDFSNWRRKQPDQKKEKLGNNGCDEGPACYQHYMRIDHLGEWDDAFQFTTHPYICEYKGRYVVSGEKKSWEEAKQECHEAGLQLAKIRSDQDLQELKNAVEHYLGPHNHKSGENSWVWVGGQRRKKVAALEVEWEFSDCEDIEWDIRWEHDTEIDKEEEDVLTMSRWGTIDTESKDGDARPFACQCPGS